MPKFPRKKNQVSTWFNRVLKETVRGDSLSEEASTATLDAAGSLYPSLPSDEKSETGLNKTETGGWGNPQLAEILKRLEQAELGNLTRDVVVGKQCKKLYKK